MEKDVSDMCRLDADYWTNTSWTEEAFVVHHSGCVPQPRSTEDTVGMLRVTMTASYPKQGESLRGALLLL